MEMRRASRRVGRKGDRRALAVSGFIVLLDLMVPEGIPAVMGAESFEETAV